MIRVIYTWRLDPERRSEFVARWRKVTRSVHETTPGALGSFCLAELEDPETVLTVALWESEAQWRAFVKTAKTGPMKALHELATQASATPFEQLGDETVTQVS